MKETIVIILAVFLVGTYAYGYIALEDFQSYADGDDIAETEAWTNVVPPNRIRCVDVGGGEKAAAFHPEGGEVWGYVWEASESVLDYGIFADFEYGADADEPSFGLCARCVGDETDFDFYGLAVSPADPAHLTLAYFYEDDVEILWVTYLDAPIAPGERHNAGFYISGDGPVNFHIYFDGVKVGSFVDDYYELPAGPAGLAAYEIFDAADVYVDNVTQMEPNVRVEPVSFGSVKTSFR
ncbi:MAG: hypothetical protein JSW52_04120 [Candidatus Coatesbacteria bacterium]|nr:MAG: hypothetical protein JSW52_04120 [Candidatus Coatesbacteria bacterium]